MPSHDSFVSFTDTRKRTAEFRVLLVGASGCGKSSLLTRHAEGVFVKAYDANDDVYFTVAQEQTEFGPAEVKYYDPPGRDSFRVIIKPHYKEVTCVVYCFDVSNAESLDKLQAYRDDMMSLKAVNKDIPSLVLGCKGDIDQDEWEISFDKAFDWAQSINAQVLSVSSKTGDGVDAAFETITDLVVAYKKKQVMDEARRRRPPVLDEVDPLDEVVYIQPSALPKDGMLPVIETCLLPTIIQMYEGDYDDAGSYQGEGRATFINGVVYDGQFLNGALQGKGTMEWPNGTVYEGEFSENTITGHGKMQWPDDTVYVGEFVNGLRDGKGTFTCSTGDSSYDGEWRGGERHGEGTLKYDTEGLTHYTGAWEHNRRHGRGSMVFASGAHYDGQWYEGKPQGHGTMVWPERSEEYTGAWRAGRPHGRGTHVWVASLDEPHLFPQLNKYTGAFQDGQREGYGVFYYASGAVYQGTWSDNLKHGRGMMTFADGSIYSGPYADDVPVSEDGVPIDSDVAVAEVPTPVNLIVRELLGDDEDPAVLDSVTADLTKSILRVLPELKSVYDAYSRVSLDPPGTAVHRAALLQFGMWTLLTDAGLTSAGGSLIRLDLQLDRNVPARLHKRDASQEVHPHSPGNLLLFRHFLSSLIRVAHDLYCNDETTVHIELAPSVEQVLLKVAALVDHDPTASLGGEDTLEVLQRYYPHLLDLYNTLADHEALPGDVNTAGLPTLRELLIALQEKRVLNEDVTPSFMVEYAAQRFRGAITDDHEAEQQSSPAPGPRSDGDLAPIDQELTFGEFVHILRGTLDGGPMAGEPVPAQFQFLCARMLFPDVIV